MPDIAKTTRSCLDCGTPIPADSDSSQCELCSLKAVFYSPDDQTSSPQVLLPRALTDWTVSTNHIGNYELISEIARGGMGVVYKARQMGSNRIVAVKMIAPQQRSTPEIIGRFRAECEIVASLDHPNILPIYEIGELDSVPYFSMKFAENGSLAEYRKRLDGRFREIAILMSKVALAVDHAHRRGVLHRDLKPANILLDHNNEPLVTDFGLARRLEQSSNLTVSHLVLGTPNYLSPEQARGDTSRLTTSSDIFSLGSILYELLTGNPPFAGDDLVQILRRVMDADVVRPSQLKPGIPRDLETICLKCLARDPKDRYLSGKASADDLQSWLAGKSIAARPSSASGKIWRWAKRNPIVASLAALLSFSLSAIAIGSTIASIRLNIALENAYLAQGNSVQHTRLAGQHFNALDALVQAARIRPSLTARNEAASALALADLRIAKTWEAKESITTPLVFDSKIENYAVAEQAGIISIRRVSDKIELNRVAYSGAPAVALSPFCFNDRFLGARRSNNHWTFWDLSYKPPKQVLDVETDSYLETRDTLHIEDGIDINCAAAPHAPRIALTLPNGGFAIYNLLTASFERKFQAPERVQAVAFENSGAQIAAGDPKHNQILIFDTLTGAQVGKVNCSEAPASLAWNPSGQELACGGMTGELSFWDPKNGELIDRVSATRSSILQLIYSADGSYLLSASTDSSIRLWDLASRFPACRLPNWGYIPAMRLSESGRQLAAPSAGNSVSVVDLNLKPVWHTLYYPKRKEEAAFANWLTFNQDSSLLAVASGGTRLYDVRTGKLIGNLSQTRAESVCFTPHGKGERLLVSGSKIGLSSWPMKRSSNSIVEIGPPMLLDTTPGYRMFGADRLGTRVVLGNREKEEIRIWKQESPQNPALIKERAPVADAAVSLDGRWLFSTVEDQSLPAGSGRAARIWDLASGEIAKQFDGNIGFAGVGRFSSDGKWLAIIGETNQVVSTSTWQPPAPTPNDLIEMSFSHSGQFLAGAFRSRITLYSFPKIAELFSIDAPYDFADDFYQVAFSPDDTKLAILSYNGAVHLLDIPRLREGLRSIGLDWDSAKPNLASRNEEAAEPLEIRVIAK
jgi:serine/threonine protein kinase/WD40 repeat protein